MFITLNEWYYHGSMCRYQTKLVAVNTDEISDVKEVRDPYHNMDGSAVYLKNGRHYNVREDFNKIMEMLAGRMIILDIQNPRNTFDCPFLEEDNDSELYCYFNPDTNMRCVGLYNKGCHIVRFEVSVEDE